MNPDAYSDAFQHAAEGARTAAAHDNANQQVIRDRVSGRIVEWAGYGSRSLVPAATTWWHGWTPWMFVGLIAAAGLVAFQEVRRVFP